MNRFIVTFTMIDGSKKNITLVGRTKLQVVSSLNNKKWIGDENEYINLDNVLFFIIEEMNEEDSL